MEATDYCPQCGAYHKICGPCDSSQTEPDVEGLEDFALENELKTN
jgi:hypothetical protein